MAHQKGKNVLTLLLVIVMVIQPVLFSYAMASMKHSHHASVSAVHSDDGHHAITEHKMVGSQTQSDYDDGNVLDDCCHTAACSPAVVMGMATISDKMRFVFSIPLAFSFEGVDLPTDIKPPRSLLG